MQRKIEKLRIYNQDSREHYLAVVFDYSKFIAKVSAFYGMPDKDWTSIAEWVVRYEAPNEYDSGNVQIGDGRIEINRESLRGLGIGSLLMIPLIRWIKSRPSVPVDNILLKGQDAATLAERNRRNRFYERLGFTFEYHDGGTWGESHAMQSSDLIEPKFNLSTYALAEHWSLESVEGHGEVF
ncbi:GNAT superfamily N-acetyltransferase [Massilia sp. UYP32]|uniref:hypothetical protein n=1 Tax=Massilia sp. UYP32 TaxID=1756386 RepID=UPI003D260E09